MLLATAGKVAVQLCNENDVLVWKAYLKNDLIAECHREDWDALEPDFTTKQAGQMLADAYNEMFAVAELDEDASMQKNDDGEVENEPVADAKEGGCCGNCDKPDGHEPCAPGNGESKLIILKLHDLLNEASLAQKANKPHDLLIKEASLWASHLESLDKMALVNHVNKLMIQAEQELSEGIDCEATLDAAATLMQITAKDEDLDNHEDIKEDFTDEYLPKQKASAIKRFFEKFAKLIK